MVLLNHADTLISTDPAAAVVAGRAAVMHCRRVGDRYMLEAAAGNLIEALVYVGEWEEAQEVYHTGVHEDRLDDYVGFNGAGLMLSVLSGDETELAATMRRLEESSGSDDPQERGTIALARSAVAAFAGRHTEGLAHGRRALGQQEALGFSSCAIRWGWPIAADAALALRDHDEVTRLLDWLLHHPPGHIPPVLRAERLRVHARLLAANNDPQAGPAFDAALQAFHDFGSPYHLCVVMLDHTEHLTTRPDIHAARSSVTEAETIAQRLGARPLLDRAQHLEQSTAGSRDTAADARR
jgi:hypothetical protein